MMRTTLTTLAAALFGAAAFAQDTLPNTGLGDPATFQHLYNRWAAAQSASKQTNVMTIALQDFGGLSSEAVDATGTVKIDLAAGTITAFVEGLKPGEWELWLVDNKAGNNSTFPDAEDTVWSAGRFRSVEGGLGLEAKLENTGADFQIDRAAVTRAGASLSEGFVLLGSASIYERVQRGLAGVRNDADLWQLIARGRRVFTGERFAGNGRTCGTCHSERNNFTIDPAFIATIPETDPLFIHEREPALRANFENSRLLRQLGLVLGNPDGGDDLARKFVLRSVPSLLSLGTQSTAPEPVFVADFTAIGPASHPAERLGWGNDALPLREFAIGAISQHMTKTLARKAGTDFRIPSDEELDALAAYQLSLGRAEDFDLTKLKLQITQAQQGQKLFLDTGKIGEPGHKNCNACHFNGGGTMAFALNDQAPGFTPLLDSVARGFNGTFGTNVNGLPASRALNVPRDGGFGKLPLPTLGFGNFGFVPGVGEFPVEEFNSNSIVESADTAPYFHNHAVATLEESIAFYGTDAYAAVESIGDKANGPIPVKISSDPRDPEVRAIATFMRLLNGLENVRSAMSAADRGRRAATLADAGELASLALEEVNDAIKVMSEGSLATTIDFGAVVLRQRLNAAKVTLESARDAKDQAAANAALTNAASLLRLARDTMAESGTLPATFQK